MHARTASTASTSTWQAHTHLAQVGAVHDFLRQRLLLSLSSLQLHGLLLRINRAPYGRGALRDLVQLTGLFYVTAMGNVRPGGQCVLMLV